MSSVRNGFEFACLAVMALWLLGGVMHALASKRVRRALERANIGLWFANWTVFGTGRERADIVRYTFRYRDAPAAGWTVVCDGRPWVWHAFLWQPERRLADRVHRIGQEISRAKAHPEGEQRVIAARRAMLVRHLEAIAPSAKRRPRHVQLIERRSSVVVDAQGNAEEAAEEQLLLLDFTLEADERA